MIVVYLQGSKGWVEKSKFKSEVIIQKISNGQQLELIPLELIDVVKLPDEVSVMQSDVSKIMI